MQTTETDQLEQPLSQELPTLRLLYAGDAGIVGRVYALASKQLLLGRDVSDQDNVRVAEDGRASRQHARIEVRASVEGLRRHPVRIVDLESKNGTFVNGVQVTEAKLSDGDIVRIGNSFLVLRYEQARRQDAEAGSLLGLAPSMRALRSRLVQAAKESQTVLLCGETGTGKEVAAQALHDASQRQGPLVAVNCAAIPSELAESQLFGHVAGSFSGARAAQQGFFRAADGGTLFLDEIGELPPVLQAKLLRALEEHAVVPVGATQPIRCDVRVVAATNRNLRAGLRDGSFRADLYARLCGVVLTLPPLRERREDILPLLVQKLGAGGAPRLSARLVEALLLHGWPFNVRELVQMADALKVHLHAGEHLDLPLIAERFEENPAAARGHAAASKADQEGHIPGTLLTPETLSRLYQENDGNVSQLARLVGRSRRHIRRLLERYGIVHAGA